MGACPDPTPFQKEVSFDLKGPNGTQTFTTREWTKAGLTAWLGECPFTSVTVQHDRSVSPNDPAYKQPLRVYIDGYYFPVPKGEGVDVPVPIAEIIRQGQQRYVTSQAAGADLNAMTITASNPNGKEIRAEELGLDGGYMDEPGAGYVED